ncbi:MAG: GNAT family N-acetyltransferase [Gemmataceae bacterium]
MRIRTFQPGDEEKQVAVFNEAAAELPKFKPSFPEEVRRRRRAPDFDPTARLYVEEGGDVVAYAGFQPNGRISFPWCRKKHEHLAEPLLEQLLQTMRQRGITTAFAAYRPDWEPILAFLRQRGFQHTRDLISYYLDLVEMPTPAARRGFSMTALQRDDIPGLIALAPDVLRITDPVMLESYFFDNPYFRAECLFVTRQRDDGSPQAVGILIDDPSYADPRMLDAATPCFRLGAFGTEGMTTKRVRGLFSFLVRDEPKAPVLALDLLGYAAWRLNDSDVETFAAQVPSDAPHLVRFYQQYFRRQGSFPILEKQL